MRTQSILWLALAAAVGVSSSVACGDPPEPKAAPAPSAAPLPPPPPVTASAPPKEEPKPEPPPPPPPPPKKTAKDVIVPGSTFLFSLADSADAQKAVDETCAKQKKDDAKQKCLDDAKASAANEGIRFEKDEKGGGWLWVSFGKDKDKEVVYNKVPVKDPKYTDNKLELTVAGKDTGKRPYKGLKDGAPTPAVELVDENTIAIVDPDPKKGRLVYKKAKLAFPGAGPRPVAER